MGKTNRNIKYLSVIFVLCLLISGCSMFKNDQDNNTGNNLADDVVLSDKGNQTKPNESDSEALQADLVEYSVYKLDEVDFQFVIARIRVKAPENINLNMSHFKTSEDIVLSDVSAYVNVLESKGLFLGKQNVWYELISEEDTAMFNIFIPVKDKSSQSVTLQLDFDENIEFDLSKATGTKEMLSYQSEDVITDGKTYQMKVSNAFVITGDTITRTYPDGYSAEYLIPSTAEVHAFRVDAVSLWGDELVIESATYTVASTKEVFRAFNDQFSTIKYTNLINQTITDTDSGILFFETLNPSENPITYTGTLELKVKGQENTIVIHVDL